MVYKNYNKILPYLFIVITYFLFFYKISYSEVKIERIDGVLDWEKQSNYTEALRLANIANDINEEKKRRKQLKDAGFSKDEIDNIIHKENFAKINGNKVVDEKQNKQNKSFLEQDNNNLYGDKNIDEEENNNNINNNFDKIYKKNNLKNIKDNKKKEELDNIREVDLTIIPPINKFDIHNDFENNENEYYDDFEISRMLKKVGDNVNNFKNFNIYAKTVSRIANKKVQQKIKIPDFKENINDDNEKTYDVLNNENKIYSFKSKKNNNLDLITKNIKNKKSNPIRNYSTDRFYAKNNNKESGEQIYLANDQIEPINILSEKQIKAKNIAAPNPIKRDLKNKNTQYQPQNISQIAYDKNNTHLTPAVFESHVINQVFESLGDDNAIQIVRALINKVGKTDITDDDGNTLLMHAVARSNQSLIATLLSEGANPNYLNKEGFSPLHLASSNGDNNAVYSLMIGGGDPNLKDYNGNTSLMYAAKMCDLNSINLMISLGGDPTMENYSTKKTALDFANENNDSEAIKLLKTQYQKLKKKKTPVVLTDNLN